MRTIHTIISLLAMGSVLAACGPAGGRALIPLTGPGHGQPASTVTPVAPDLAAARSKIKHVVIIMQENRSFDTYFGTYPGADGIPSQNGKFTVCVNDPNKGTCVYPFHDP